MQPPLIRLRSLALAAVLLACAAAPSAAQAAGPGVPRADSAALAAARPDNERYPWTEADARFMTMMIAHHAQAIEMSRLAPERAENPSVRTLAARIINAQHDEIVTMQQWLRDRGRPAPEPGTTADPAHAGHGAGGHGAGHGAGGHDHGGGEPMHGMLTPAQMARLGQARGAEFDQLFLTYMIQHHRGATQMVRELFGTPGAGQDETVFRFATDVNVDQETEIARMQRMLAELVFGATVP